MLRSPIGLLAHDARFKGDVELEFLGNGRWTANAPVELRDRPMLTSAETTELAALDGEDLASLFADIAALHQIINYDLPGDSA